MTFYWVNCGSFYKEVSELKFLWAPAYVINNKGKKTISAGWESVREVKKGDIIFCHKRGAILSIAIALKDAYFSKRPENRVFNERKDEGYKIDVDLEEFEVPISTEEFKEQFISLYNNRCNPKVFTEKKQATQQYMAFIPDGAGALILECLGDASIRIHEKLELLNVSNDISKSKPTFKQALIKARVGQGQFRNAVLNLWESTCPITKINKPELLVASHIVSWQLSNNEEKLDQFNGFPLSPDVDKLFDKGFISFSDAGEIIQHQSIKDTDILRKLGIDKANKIDLKEGNIPYLKRHREIYGF